MFEGLNKQVDIRITWDKEARPAVYASLADFFGYAFGKISTQSLLVGTRENSNYSYFPMPFDEKAKIELVYRPSVSSAKNISIPVKGQRALCRNCSSNQGIGSGNDSIF